MKIRYRKRCELVVFSTNHMTQDERCNHHGHCDCDTMMYGCCWCSFEPVGCVDGTCGVCFGPDWTTNAWRCLADEAAAGATIDTTARSP